MAILHNVSTNDIMNTDQDLIAKPNAENTVISSW